MNQKKFIKVLGTATVLAAFGLVACGAIPNGIDQACELLVCLGEQVIQGFDVLLDDCVWPRGVEFGLPGGLMVGILRTLGRRLHVEIRRGGKDAAVELERVYPELLDVEF